MEPSAHFRPHYAAELYQAYRHTPYRQETAGPLALAAIETDRQARVNIISSQKKTFGNAERKELLSGKPDYDTVRREYTARALYGPNATRFHGFDCLPLPPHRRLDLNQSAAAKETNGHRATHAKLPWADLCCTIDHPSKVSSPVNYERRRFRWEEDWIHAQTEEDRFVLFGDPSLDTQYPVPTPTDVDDRISSTAPLLHRWAAVKQERYFWDFLDCYDTQRLQKDSFTEESFEKRPPHSTAADIAEQRRQTQEQFQRERQMHSEKGQRVVTVTRPHEFLPTIFPPLKGSQSKRHLKERYVSFNQLAAVGEEIAQITCCPPFQVDFCRWCTNTLRPRFIRRPAEERIMSYFDEQTHPVYPSGVKSFEDTYPNVPQHILEKTRLEREAQERLKKKGWTEADTTVAPVEKREPRKVGGGRYALR